MKKPHKFNVMSILTCKCGRRIKANVAERKGVPPELCYKCHRGQQAGRSHYINFKPRKKRVGVLPVKDYSGQPGPLAVYRQYLKRCA